MEMAFQMTGSFGTLTTEARAPIFSSKGVAVPYYRVAPYPTATGKAASECVDINSFYPDPLMAAFNDNVQFLVDKEAVLDVMKQTEAKMATGFPTDMSE